MFNLIKNILDERNVRKISEQPAIIDDSETFAVKAGLPDMNVTFEYENPTNNGIALVTKAVMYYQIQYRDSGEATEEEIAEINDILYNPGYAPMERLAKAFAFTGGGADPYTADPETYVVDFANDWERLAFAICPDMFAKPKVLKTIFDGAVTAEYADSNVDIDVNYEVSNFNSLADLLLTITFNGTTYENVEPSYDSSSQSKMYYKWVFGDFDNMNLTTVRYGVNRTDESDAGWQFVNYEACTDASLVIKAAV